MCPVSQRQAVSVIIYIYYLLLSDRLVMRAYIHKIVFIDMCVQIRRWDDTTGDGDTRIACAWNAQVAEQISPYVCECCTIIWPRRCISRRRSP